MYTPAPLKHNPVTFILRTLLYCVVAALLRLLTFAPLVSLLVFPVDSPLRYLALLCPVLFVFLLLPLRFSFAQALAQNPPGRFFSFDVAFGIRPYGEKLGEGLLHALSVLKWGIPLGVIVAIWYNHLYVDATEPINALIILGKDVTKLYVQVAVFLGNLNAKELPGGLAEGIYVLLGVLGVGVLILLVGIMRNSAFRYIWAKAYRENHSPRTEARKRLHHRRFLQLLAALLNLLLLAPFLWAVARSIKTVVGDLAMVIASLRFGGSAGALDLGGALSPFLFAFFCLYLPLLPIRRMVTAYFATKHIRPAARKNKAPKAQPQAAAYTPGAAPTPAYIPPMQPAAYPEPYPPATGEAPILATLEADAATGEFFPPIEEDSSEGPRDDRDPSAFTLGQ